MSDKKRVAVKIDGKEFKVVSTEEEGYVLKIAHLVDKSIREITHQNSMLNKSMAYILAAFNIADKYYKKQAEFEDLIKRATEAFEEFESKKLDVEEYEKLKAERAESESSKKELKGELESLAEEVVKLKKENERLAKKNDEQEQALTIKDDELSMSEEKIKDLQNKLFKLKVETGIKESTKEKED